jgi:protein tyrosine phosphatase (PTP) superfamily phosphohydrolase (DUF442 family)
MKRHALLKVVGALALVPALTLLAGSALGFGYQPAKAPENKAQSESEPGAKTGAEVHHVPVLVAGQGLFSGPSPVEAHDFAELKSLGVKTIISVDGARPEIELAKAEGMRYVHIPVGYHGVSREQTLAIARAIKDLPGPVYVHCHHGKHRGPTAVATAAIALGRINTEQALAFMKIAQTAPSYTGLWQCAREMSVVELSELESAPAEFPEVAPVGDMVTAMVEVDERAEHLKLVEKAAWGVPPEHPDLVPVAEAARLVDLYRSLAELEATKTRHAELPALFEKAAAEAKALETLLEGPSVDATKASAAYKAVAQSCKDCHKAHRD